MYIKICFNAYCFVLDSQHYCHFRFIRVHIPGEPGHSNQLSHYTIGWFCIIKKQAKKQTHLMGSTLNTSRYKYVYGRYTSRLHCRQPYVYINLQTVPHQKCTHTLTQLKSLLISLLRKKGQIPSELSASISEVLVEVYPE